MTVLVPSERHFPCPTPCPPPGRSPGWGVGTTPGSAPELMTSRSFRGHGLRNPLDFGLRCGGAGGSQSYCPYPDKTPQSCVPQTNLYKI